MRAWTIVAWIIDSGLLLNAILVIRYRLGILADRGWDGIPLVILLAVALLASIVGSVALTWAGETRGARIASLVVAGAVPAAGFMALLGMLLTGLVLMTVGGGSGKFR